MSASWKNSQIACSVLSGALVFAAVPTAHAQDVGRAAPSNWTFTFSTYSWLPWLSGDVSIKGRSVTVDVAPDQLIEALDWSGLPIWMSYAEAQNGRLTLFNDIVYSKVAGSADFAKSKQGKFVSATLAGSVEGDYEQATIELGAAYEVWSGGTANSTRLELLAGGRYWHQEVNVSADLNATITASGPLGLRELTVSGNRVFAKSGSVEWVDPFIGARIKQSVAPGQDILVRADAGGFGAGSDFSWQVLALYNWRVCFTDGYAVDAYLGYRALSVDYSEGSGTSRYEYDVLQQGPVIGMTMRF